MDSEKEHSRWGIFGSAKHTAASADEAGSEGEYDSEGSSYNEYEDDGIAEEDEANEQGSSSDGATVSDIGEQGLLQRGTALFVRRRPPTFRTMIERIQITNMGRRRRSVQLIFIVGGSSAEGGAEGAEQAAPAASTGAEVVADGAAPPEGQGAEGRHNKRGRRMSLRGSRRKQSAGAGAAATTAGRVSKPKQFTTDVIDRLEAGRTDQFKSRFQTNWVGAHDELSRRGVVARLVEKTRFGNIIDIGQYELSLVDIANGSVQQDIVFTEQVRPFRLAPKAPSCHPDALCTWRGHPACSFRSCGLILPILRPVPSDPAACSFRSCGLFLPILILPILILPILILPLLRLPGPSRTAGRRWRRTASTCSSASRSTSPLCSNSQR